MEELRLYESTYILSPELTPDETQAAIEKYNGILRDSGAETVNQELWGLRQLAYPIRKKTNGYYVFTEFKGNVSIVAKLEQEYQYNPNVMRYLTVKMDKHHAAYAVKRRGRLSVKSREAAERKAALKDSSVDDEL